MFTGFSSAALHFLEELGRHNDREWFSENKIRYEDTVLKPALEFVAAMERPLRKISPHFLAIPKRVGGSVMRIYRDTRFSNDKTPYKTNLGIHFRHEAGKNVHAPGFYFHVDPDRIFVGCGIWHPDGVTLNQIRQLIDDDPIRWKRITRKAAFQETFQMAGDVLTRPPKGYSADHPLIEDLKRKDHIVLAELSRADIASGRLTNVFVDRARLALPYVRFLCDALHLPC